MKTLRAMLVRFVGLFRRKQHEAEMNEELRAHLDGLIERNLAAGMSADEARYAALREFGGVAQIAERARDERRSVWVENFFQDLHYAVRALRKTPSFTLTAVLTLALGIGVNAALFTIYNAVSLRSLPVREPDELILVRGLSDRLARGNDSTFTYPEYLDYRDSNHVFSGLAAHFRGLRGHPLEAPIPGEAPRSTLVLFKDVSENYFSVLGADLMLGRSFLPEEVQVAEPSVIVLSHRFWERYWHSDPNVLGKMQRVNGRACTVVGVAGPEFLGDTPVPPAGWMPIASAGPEGLLQLVGRLKPGVTPAQAKADLDVIAQRRAQADPREGRKTAVETGPAMRWLHIPMNPLMIAALSPLLLGFAMVLLIACTNVTNLLLARGVTRQMEIGVRLTLGASRGRIIRQLLTENLLLCILGAGAGLVLALWTLQMVRPLVLSFVPAEWAPLTEMWQALKVGPDGRVIGCTVALALIAAIAAGLAPAMHASRTNLISTLKDEGSAFGRRLRHSRLRNFLVVSQVAVCLVLLSCSGVLVRTLWRVQGNNLGFEPQRVIDVEASWTKPTLGTVKRAWVREFMIQARALPGVVAISATHGGPLQSLADMTRRIKDPAASAVPALHFDVNHSRVSAGFFETFGIGLRGRDFTPQEDADPHARVVVISEFVARRLWPEADPLGRLIAISVAPNSDSYVEYRVIGVARDVGDQPAGWREAFAYLPLAADNGNVSAMFLRLRDANAAPPAALVDLGAAAGVKIEFTRHMATRAQERLLPFQAMAALSGALGGLALLMSAVGLYGVMSFSVSQRTREIGIRVALGASVAAIMRLFVRHGMRLVALGAAIGLGGTLLTVLALTKMYSGFGAVALANRIHDAAFDPVAYLAVTLILAVVALLACWLPARRATKVDPMVALRCE